MSKRKRRVGAASYQHGYETRDKGGSSRQYIDWKKCCPDGRPDFYEPKKGRMAGNIIPYEIKSKLHPLVKEGKMKIGDMDFVLDVWVHMYVPPSSTHVLCPKKNYRKPCPICDYVSELYEKGDKEAAGKLKARRRVLYNFQPIVDGEPGGLKVFEVSHYLYHKELMEEAYELEPGNDVLPFAEIDGGKIVQCRVVDGDLDKSVAFKSFKFRDREEEISQDVLDKAISFDEGLILLPPKEIEGILYGADDDDDEDEEEDKPKSSKKKPKDDDEEDADEEESSKRRNKKADKDEDDEEDSRGKKCPHGYKWGEADDHKECEKCKKWDPCMDAQK